MNCGHPIQYFDGERCRVCLTAQQRKRARLDRIAAEMRQRNRRIVNIRQTLRRKVASL